MKTAEDVLREYVDFVDVNGNDTISLLPITIVDAMEEYAEQCGSINNVTTDNLTLAFSLFRINIDRETIDKIIDIVELLQKRGDDASMTDFAVLESEWG